MGVPDTTGKYAEEINILHIDKDQSKRKRWIFPSYTNDIEYIIKAHLDYDANSEQGDHDDLNSTKEADDSVYHRPKIQVLALPLFLQQPNTPLLVYRSLLAIPKTAFANKALLL